MYIINNVGVPIVNLTGGGSARNKMKLIVPTVKINGDVNVHDRNEFCGQTVFIIIAVLMYTMIMLGFL